jgi:3-methyladenine DNA glycosylase/8-oxoguanine DNA glycosylase
LDLPTRQPFDAAALAAFLAPRAIPGVEAVAGTLYRRSVDLDGAQGTLAVDLSGPAPRLRVDGPVDREAVAARLRRVLDLDADPCAIARALAADPRLAPLVAARPGLRVPGGFDGFELGVRAILGQQVSVAGASTLAGRLVAAYGRPLPAHLAGDGLTHTFPAPRELVGRDLAHIGLPGARARAIARLAEAACADPNLFVATGSLAADLARLGSLPGIGPWSANYIAMRALGHRDAFPAGDLGLRRALAEDGVLPSHSALAAAAEAWRPWRAYAALHLWTGLDPGPMPRRARR